jgi:hypothetical protein
MSTEMSGTTFTYATAAPGGYRVQVYTDSHELNRWISEGVAHAGHDGDPMPHRADICATRKA